MESNEGTQTATCRVCLLEGNIPIYGNRIFNDVSQDLIAATGISIQEDDAYPKHLCVGCHSLLQDSILLRFTAQHSDQVLKQNWEIETDDMPMTSEEQAVDDCSMDSGGDPECLQEANINVDQDKKASIKQIEYTSKKNHVTIPPKIFGSKGDDGLSTNRRSKQSNVKARNMPAAKPGRKRFIGQKFNDKKNNCVYHRRGKYYCKKCGIDLETELKYDKHIQSEEHKNFKVKCPVCSKKYKPLYLKTHLEFHNTEKAHVCEICGKNFHTKNLCKQHRDTHFLDLPFKCAICPYRGRTKYCVTRHMKSHEEKKTHECPECLKLYTTNGNLRKHMLIHKTVRDFQCDMCPRGFYSNPDLQKHMKSDHMGIKEHVCDICGKEFGHRAKMMKHKLKVHKRQKMPAGRTRLYLIAESQKLDSLKTEPSTNNT